MCAFQLDTQIRKHFFKMSLLLIATLILVNGQNCRLAIDPLISGCSDGTREWFFDIVKHPFIAGCSGAWNITGLRIDANTVRNTPTCSRSSGNTGINLNGTGCSAVDLCANGWSICS
jgi:hypothetical protein